MLDTMQMEASGRYLARGRPLQSLSDKEVMDRWVASFRAIVEHRTPETFQANDDAGSELQLRGIKPDNNLIKDELAVVAEEIRQEQMDHPEGSRGVRDAIAEYMRRVDEDMN